MAKADNPFDLHGKVALITGAGRGIGRSTAVAMAQVGADVGVVSRTRAELNEVVESVKSFGGQALGIQADVAEPGAGQRVVKACVERFGSLNILVNNAGSVIRKRAEETLPEDWDAILALNVKATAEMCRAAIPHLRKGGAGAIVNMSSITGMVATPLRAAYASSKMAVLGYTRVLAKELAAEGIRVNAVQPGFIETAFVMPYLSDKPEEMKRVLGHIPLNRVGTPEEVAWTIVFLASSAASYITGQAIVMDGGWTLF